MDSKTYNKDLRKTCVEAVFDEFAEHGDMIRPQYAEQWDEIYASRFLGHITGPMDIDVPDLVDVIMTRSSRKRRNDQPTTQSAKTADTPRDRKPAARIKRLLHPLP